MQAPYASLAAPALILLQGLSGFGIAARLYDTKKPAQVCALSMLIGLPASSLVLFTLELLGIPLRLGPFLIASVLLAFVLNLGNLRNLTTTLRRVLHRPGVPTPAECVFLLFFLFLVTVSLWQCIWLPVTPRDALVGMDLVAKYAVAEGTLKSSVFTGPELAGHLSHQPYYAPFTALMQIAFRLVGFPFGTIWLCLLFVSLLVFLYSRLREILHPTLAGALLVCLVSIPSMFSQTYLVLTDFANAVFFFLSVLALHDFLGRKEPRMLLLSSLFMGFACWSRSETILFVPFALLLVLTTGRGVGWWRSVRLALAFAVAPIVLFILWHGVYCEVYLDHSFFRAAGFGRQPLTSLSSVAWEMLRLMNAPELYGSMFYIFALGMVINVLVRRDLRGADLLLWIGILLIGFAFLVLFLPAASVGYTVKRGYLKLFPIMVLYLGESRLLSYLSAGIYRWEGRDGRRQASEPPPLMASGHSAHPPS